MATNTTVIEKPKCSTFAVAREKAKETYFLASASEFTSEAIKVLKARGCEIKLLPDNPKGVTRLNVRVVTAEGEAIVPEADIITLVAWKEKVTGIWRVQTKKSLEDFLKVYWTYAFCYLSNPFGLSKRVGDEIDDSALDGVEESTVPVNTATVPAGSGNVNNIADVMAGLMK